MVTTSLGCGVVKANGSVIENTWLTAVTAPCVAVCTVTESW